MDFLREYDKADHNVIVALSGLVNPVNFNATPRQAQANRRPTRTSCDVMGQVRHDKRTRNSYCPPNAMCYSCVQYLLRIEDKTRQKYREACLWAKAAENTVSMDTADSDMDTTSDFDKINLDDVMSLSGLYNPTDLTDNARKALRNMRYTVREKGKVSFCPMNMPCNCCIQYQQRMIQKKISYRDRCSWAVLTDHLDKATFGPYNKFFRRKLSLKKKNPPVIPDAGASPEVMIVE